MAALIICLGVEGHWTDPIVVSLRGLLSRWCCHGMRGRLTTASIIDLIALWRIVWLGNASRNTQIKALINMNFSIIRPLFGRHLKQENSRINILHLSIYTLLNAFAKKLMLILRFT